MKPINGKYFTGWRPDLPDHRDYTLNHKKIKSTAKNLGLIKEENKDLPTFVDLRPWCPPVFDQGRLGSCTANAGVGLVEYTEIITQGNYIDLSRLFLYKVERDLMHLEGDTGGALRSTMEALVLLGIPPEEYWPYDITQFDQEPSAFCYGLAENYESLCYLSLDPAGMALTDVLIDIKCVLAAGLATMFGFTVYDSIVQAGTNGGKIPFPANNENVLGGHAIMAVGYDDSMVITNSIDGSKTTGAFLIRNSWGDWGDHGYGWLPYNYLLIGLAQDWWTILEEEWVDLGVFGQLNHQQNLPSSKKQSVAAKIPI